MFRFVENPIMEGQAFQAGGLFRFVLEKLQLLDLGGELFKRLQIFAKILDFISSGKKIHS